jgi:hypothetical protein
MIDVRDDGDIADGALHKRAARVTELAARR